MSYFDKLAELGFMVVCRRNQLGTTAMFAVLQSDVPEEDGWDASYRIGSPVMHIGAMLASLPEWRVVDFTGDDAAGGAKLLYEKLTCTGKYADWDRRLQQHEAEHVRHGGPEYSNASSLLIGFEHRPESERFQA